MNELPGIPVLQTHCISDVFMNEILLFGQPCAGSKMTQRPNSDSVLSGQQSPVLLGTVIHNLQTKLRLLYLKTQSVPRSIHFSSRL